MHAAIGIDAGCTNIKAVAVEPTGQVVADVERSTRAGMSHSASVKEALAQLRDRLDDRPTPLGLAAPGVASLDARSIAFLPGRQTDLEGLVWTTELEWPTPVPVLNDAHAALMGEAWCGAAAGCSNVTLLTLGTGVGGAMMIEGRLVRGQHGRAGHLGHISINLDGAPGILKTPGPLENYLGECTVSQRTAGRYASNRAVLEAAQRGDAEARHDWQDMIRALAVGIASLVQVADPEMIVIGGGVAQAGDALFEPLRHEMERVEWRPDGQGVKIVPAALGRFAGAIGAARQAMLECAR